MRQNCDIRQQQTLRQLGAFAAEGRQGTVSELAAALRLSRDTVSRVLRDLENLDLVVRVERKGRNVRDVWVAV